ncbi:MAG: M48 family metallopeptidase [Lachnospiraceae bacterium]|nr:M48 family metallopeptidase [Lachnospiraceae bacterium]
MDKGMPEYRLIRGRRKTIGIEIDPSGVLIVRAPRWVSKNDIESFLVEKESWIKKHLSEMRQRVKEMEALISELGPITGEEIKALADRMMKEFPPRVEEYASKLGVNYGRVTIRVQRTRWGSCSAKGNLNFNCLLMLLPKEVQDYVIVHELCHRKEMNHSARFWELVGSVIPDYKKLRNTLREEGRIIMMRAFEAGDR